MSVQFIQKSNSLINDNSKERLSGPQKYDLAFKGISPENMFRLFIDKARQSEGEDAFEKTSPGYKKAMLNAYTFIRETIDESVNATYYCQLHEICVDGVQTMEFIPGTYGERDMRPMKKGVQSYNQFGFDMKLLSYAGYLESLEKKFISFNGDDPSFLAYAETYNGRTRICSQFSQANGGMAKLQSFFTYYHHEISLAHTEREKIVAIVHLLKSLIIYHVLPDGNLRTNGAIMNKLLVQNGLDLVFFDDPAILVYHSIEELVDDIYKGMENVREYKRLLNG